MATLLALAGGAVINALAFSGSNYMFHKLSSSDEERERHDKATESEQKARNAWLQKRQENFDAERRRQEQARTSEGHFQELDASMREYARSWEEANPKPQFHQYYTPSAAQQKKDYVGALVAIAAIGGAAYYFL